MKRDVRAILENIKKQHEGLGLELENPQLVEEDEEGAVGLSVRVNGYEYRYVPINMEPGELLRRFEQAREESDMQAMEFLSHNADVYFNEKNPEHLERENHADAYRKVRMEAARQEAEEEGTTQEENKRYLDNVDYILEEHKEIFDAWAKVIDLEESSAEEVMQDWADIVELSREDTEDLIEEVKDLEKEEYKDDDA